MAVSIPGGLEKLKLVQYQNSAMDDSSPPETRVYINPEKYTRTYTICYNNTAAQGDSGGSPTFNKTPPDQLDFELIFDGTGVVPSPVPGTPREDGIVEQVKRFTDIVEKYDGKIHSPNYVGLFWGDLVFKGRLKTFKITYTLFKPDGTPLRARANATFIGYTDPIQLANEENKSSPDLSHFLTVVAGDTLPLMCYRVYGSSVYYIQVANANNLTEFRQLVVGSQLVFPPLAGAPA